MDYNCRSKYNEAKGVGKNALSSEVGSNTNQKGKTRLKPCSDKQAERLKEYRIVRDEYMRMYPNCEFPECPNRSQDLHHGAGRVGDLLTNTKYFVALCRMHHSWVEEHPREAKELGLSFSRLSKAKD